VQHFELGMTFSLPKTRNKTRVTTDALFPWFNRCFPGSRAMLYGQPPAAKTTIYHPVDWRRPYQWEGG